MLRYSDVSQITAFGRLTLLDRAVFASISAMSVFALFSPLF